jgi:protein required for attachment to host cells
LIPIKVIRAVRHHSAAEFFDSEVRTMKPVRTWILIADGARARIVLNEGPGKGVVAVDGGLFEQDARATREIMSDRPGRTFDSAGAGRHAMELPTDPAREEKRHFAERLAEHLDGAVARNAFDRLIVVAAPSALGDLRAAVSDRVRGRILAELDKDLTKVPNDKLASHLGDVIAL